jgi:transposase-like protein
MSRRKPERLRTKARRRRRQFTEEFKAEAVQMVLDGHAAASICERLGLSSPNLLYRWKREAIRQGGVAAVGLEGRVRELEAELRRVERERDILKKALSIFGRDG